MNEPIVFCCIEWGDPNLRGGFPRSLQVETDIAVLWRAAPDLLAALELVTRAFNRLRGPDDRLALDIVRICDAAITKSREANP